MPRVGPIWRFCFPFPPNISLSPWNLWNLWWCWKLRGPQKCTFRVRLSILCEPWWPGFWGLGFGSWVESFRVLWFREFGGLRVLGFRVQDFRVQVQGLAVRVCEAPYSHFGRRDLVTVRRPIPDLRLSASLPIVDLTLFARVSQQRTALLGLLWKPWCCIQES